MRTKKWKEDFFCLLGLIGAWALFHYRILFLGQTFVLVDSSGFFYPLWKWGSHWINEGVIPLWNPDTAFGTPYLADPEMDVWYPPLRLAYGVLDPSDAFRFSVIAHQFWALLGFYLFARDRKFSPLVSLLGCLAFGFSVNAVSLMEISTMLFAFSWIPWVFLACWRLWERADDRSFLFFSLALAMQTACGYPLFAYLTMLFLGLDLSIRSWSSWRTQPRQRRRILRWAGLTFAACLLALLFNLSWLLPFGEFLKFSNLGQRLVMTQGVEWKHLASWLNPFYAGHPLHSYAGMDPTVSNYFAGVPAVVLLVWGTATRKVERSTLGMAVFVFLLSTGNLFKLGEWLKSVLPGYRWVVRSGYLIPWVLFFVSWLSMQSAASRTDRPDTGGPRTTVWLILTVLTAAGALALGVPFDLGSFWLGIICLLATGLKSFGAKAWKEGFLVAALVFSLGPVCWSLNYTIDRSFYETQPAICAKLAKPGRLFHDFETIQMGSSVSAKSIQDAYEQLKGCLMPNWPLSFGFEEAFNHNSFFLSGYLRWWYGALQVSPEFSRKVLDYLNVNYFWGRGPIPGFRRLEGGPSLDPVWENPTPLPKWDSVQEALPATNWDRDLIWASRHSYNFKDDCFMGNSALAGPYVRRQAALETLSPDHEVLEASGQGRALLVSSETAYPGWVARSGNGIKDFEVVNYGFKGIVLESGEKKVDMEYRPSTFRLGVFLSLLVAGFWAALISKIGVKALARI